MDGGNEQRVAIKQLQIEKFSVDFQKLYHCKKACIYVNGAYFEFKKSYVYSSCVLDLKKSDLNLLDRRFV
jgi:hypothetical protein